MRRIFLLITTFSCNIYSFAQDHGFAFGQITYRELEMKKYDADTSASAVILDEFGEAYVDNQGNNNLIFEHHIKIKILKVNGLEKADFTIPLWKYNGETEILRSVQASSFNVDNRIVETKLESKNVFTVNRNSYLDVKKFAIPKVVVGSVIEIKYVLESPFLFKFRSWDFQSDIPKVKSVYWATMPGNYVYNITLKGYLQLDKKESEIISGCFTPGGDDRADCQRLKLSMINIPAFIEEDFITAPSNYISSVNFELSEVKHFDGMVNKITKEWKDVEEELKQDKKFGGQLRKGKDLGEIIEQLVASENDPVARAKKVYYFISTWFRWNKEDGKYCENGIKKAFESKTGNVGDINLSLIAALRFASLNAEPCILSTRENGFVTELHPVLTDFNYVIAKLNINGKSYLLDATDPFLPFGSIPIRCLNGNGRVLGEKESYWHELKTADKRSDLILMILKLEEDGIFRGSIQHKLNGYEALDERKKIKSFNSLQEYTDNLDAKWTGIEIKKLEVENLDNYESALVEKLEVEIRGFEGNVKQFLLNPFLINKTETNPFKSDERLYPVDFAAPSEVTVHLNLDYGDIFEITDLPKNARLALPNNGGRYLMNIKNESNHLSLNSSLTINKTFYSSEEYHGLKELFNRIINIQNTDLVFKRK